ncbi:hypothetical protein PAXRUDRAFT_717114 [Paxillus rubicundulus Ve08.2h10]|uniref:Uncharacterized protein n=1 Tax=Paxillus rubicundulus Ve08.2h10 TaxID=930991 RepID=A0A0D0DIK8_9AGAM|nr:hypothetical protein PAXRUDRAFT_717114 [Paxillus rubicundulus Ve08.2h10]
MQKTGSSTCSVHPTTANKGAVKGSWFVQVGARRCNFMIDLRQIRVSESYYILMDHDSGARDHDSILWTW